MAPTRIEIARAELEDILQRNDDDQNTWPLADKLRSMACLFDQADHSAGYDGATEIQDDLRKASSIIEREPLRTMKYCTTHKSKYVGNNYCEDSWDFHLMGACAVVDVGLFEMQPDDNKAPE